MPRTPGCNFFPSHCPSLALFSSFSTAKFVSLSSVILRTSPKRKPQFPLWTRPGRAGSQLKSAASMKHKSPTRKRRTRVTCVDDSPIVRSFAEELRREKKERQEKCIGLLLLGKRRAFYGVQSTHMRARRAVHFYCALAMAASLSAHENEALSFGIPPIEVISRLRDENRRE